jgi:hypothetical protein
MAGVFRNIDPPHRPANVYPPPLVRGEDTLAGWSGGSIFWKTTGTALYSTYVSTLWGKLIIRPLTRWHHDRKRGDTPVSQEDKERPAAHSAAAAVASHDGLSVKVLLV